MVGPLGLVLVAGEERVVVHGEQGVVQPAVAADGRDVLGVARAVEDHPAAGHARVPVQPVVVEVVEVGGAVRVRLVDHLEVGVRVAAVGGDDGVPHLVEARRAGRPAVGVRPVRQDHLALAERGVDRTGVGRPVAGDGRLVDRHADGVGAGDRVHLADHPVRDGRRGGVRVGRAEPRGVQHTVDEVVTLVGPVHALELVGRRVCRTRSDGRQCAERQCEHGEQPDQRRHVCMGYREVRGSHQPSFVRLLMVRPLRSEASITDRHTRSLRREPKRTQTSGCEHPRSAFVSVRIGAMPNVLWWAVHRRRYPCWNTTSGPVRPPRSSAHHGKNSRQIPALSSCDPAVRGVRLRR
ncbi:hypothetical protein SBRY_40863 [Actinacidiphila bryophytorum]|uniref:Uncharacterized protein n=1 Tax=Actinacidiphila bryophytorum TaxID=1436133 RepID=A0A9W4MDV0_9ACTN|nr:hypothetical protein SBRY_40863 [Actinacidiphila bryophytorum]